MYDLKCVLLSLHLLMCFRSVQFAISFLRTWWNFLLNMLNCIRGCLFAHDQGIRILMSAFAVVQIPCTTFVLIPDLACVTLPLLPQDSETHWLPSSCSHLCICLHQRVLITTDRLIPGSAFAVAFCLPWWALHMLPSSFRCMRHAKAGSRHGRLRPEAQRTWTPMSLSQPVQSLRWLRQLLHTLMKSWGHICMWWDLDLLVGSLQLARRWASDLSTLHSCKMHAR